MPVWPLLPQKCAWVTTRKLIRQRLLNAAWRWLSCLWMELASGASTNPGKKATATRRCLLTRNASQSTTPWTKTGVTHNSSQWTKWLSPAQLNRCLSCRKRPLPQRPLAWTTEPPSLALVLASLPAWPSWRCSVRSVWMTVFTPLSEQSWFTHPAS